MEHGIFNLALERIQDIKKQISGMSFEKAFDHLEGHNKDDDLFDFYVDYITSMNDYMIGTVHNVDGKAVIDDGSFWEYWDGDEEIFEMTEQEIAEQVERLE